ncbi:amino acid ABC transporter permease [Syntrophomonas wolfei]|jgi:polar amino acid transport system permease protein|uniref:amino acid ABC transporter permease n=1 Tax=Syntrophomonas wolfei TaxID=863 RepID=UPI000773B322|nr:amino acid ABC transporter permease [Syntrophomonas wolfei]
MELNFDTVIRNLPLFWQATLITVKITVLAFVFALIIAFTVGVLRSYKIPGLFKVLLAVYVEIFRGTPLLIQLFFIYYGLPSVGIIMDAFSAAVIGLALNGGAYMSESVRASILSVSKGQEEAAYSLGYNKLEAIWHIILPQAIRVAIPPLMNGFSSMLKETSLVSVISITELTRTGNLIYSRTARPFEIYLTLGLFYFVLTFSIVLLAKQIERKERRWIL